LTIQKHKATIAPGILGSRQRGKPLEKLRATFDMHNALSFKIIKLFQNFAVRSHYHLSKTPVFSGENNVSGNCFES
jgi:hypothetical protein